MMRIILDKNLPGYEARKKVTDYARENKVDQSVLMTVAGAANCKIDYFALSRKGEFDMCTLFDEIAKESEKKGKAEGKEEGEAIGEARGKKENQLEMIKSMLKEGLSIESIARISKLSVDEIEKIVK